MTGEDILIRKRVAEMTAEEILGDRKWPAWWTTQQAREQMEHEERREWK